MELAFETLFPWHSSSLLPEALDRVVLRQVSQTKIMVVLYIPGVMNSCLIALPVFTPPNAFSLLPGVLGGSVRLLWLSGFEAAAAR